MAPEQEFSFAKLPDEARRHIRVFQIHQFLDRLAMGMTVAVVALALIDRGMDLFQISLLFGVYALTTMALELPFGGLADAIGRKVVFLTAVVASLISLGLFLSTSNFYVLALSFAFIGLGRALRSGTLDAWFVETFRSVAPKIDVQPALAKAQWANAMGLAIGAVLGGFLPDAIGFWVEGFGFSIYDASYFASFAVTLFVAGFTVFAIEEAPRPLSSPTPIHGIVTVPIAIRDAALLALRHPTLSLLLAALAFFLIATNPVEVLWPTHVRPMLEQNFANTFIGLLTASYFFAIACGAWLSPHISLMFKRRHAITLAATFGCLAGIQVALALQNKAIGFAMVFILYAVALGLSETPASSILHRCVADHQRSTMLSLRSLIQQLGAAIGLILAGGIADIYSTPLAWIFGAVFLVLAACLAGVLSKQLSANAA